MSDDLVNRAREVLDGVTPGPWREDGPTWNKIVWSDADNRVCFMAHSNGLNDYRDEATARFIAASRQLVPKMADCIEALQAEVREMALQYLATAGQAQEALAEVERMRGALRALMDVVDHPDQNDNKLSRYHYDWHRIDDEINSARAALDPRP